MSYVDQDSTATSNFHPALEALAAGLCPVPPKMDGSKAPIGTWKSFQHFPPDETQIRKWYSASHLTGYGLVTGKVSGNLELLEFDCITSYHRFKSAAAEAGLGDLVDRIEAGYSEQTPKPGIHWLYRCPEIAGNTELASRPKTAEEMKHPKDKAQVLIETRGEGGYVIVAPSNGKTHPSGGCYSLMAGGFSSIATITPDERRDLFTLARTFHVAPAAAKEQAEKDNVRNQRTHSPSSDGRWQVRPGDDFNANAVWRELLEAQGWTFVYHQEERDYWRRPGKDQGISACTNWEGKDYFYCFSTSTDFEAEKPIDKVGFHARTMHGGNFKAAIRALAEAGYGTPAPDIEEAKTGSARPAGAESAGGGGQETDLNLFRGTDDANADLLLKLHGADIRYCPPWDKWLLWAGSHWQIDTRLDIDRLSADVPRALRTKALNRTQEQQQILAKVAAILAQIATAEPDQSKNLTKEHGRLAKQQAAIGDEVDWLLKLARKLEGVGSRNSMQMAARHKVVVHHSDLDKGHFLLNAANGTVDLTSGNLRPHERRDLLTHDVEIPFDSATAAPNWLVFLNSTFAGDTELIAFVQRAVGYSLTGDVREQVLLICHGVGSNGKSVFLNILRKLLGNLAWQAAPDLLMADKQRRHPTEQADLFGKRLVVCQETGEGRRFNETLVKQLTGGDGITARRMHEDFWQFNPTHKLWLSTNHKPEIRGTDHAIWRRIRLIPFNVKFTDDGPARKDPEMEAKLTAELPGILAWAIKGCLYWQRQGLKPPAAVADATAGYQAEMDVLAAWLAECCIVGKRYEAKAADLYASYCAWCEQGGERPETQRKWGMRLTERGFIREQRRAAHYWIGIGVVDHRDPCDPCDPEKAKNRFSDFSKTLTGKHAVEGSQGSQGSQSPPVEPAFEGRDVEEF